MEPTGRGVETARHRGLVPILGLALAVGCGSPAEPDGPSSPTWHRDVAPVVHTHCGGCHGPEGIGPSFTAPEDAASWAPALAEAAWSRRMPPWAAGPPDEGCVPPHPVADDPTLDDATLSLLSDWSDAGAPLGDPATAAALPEPVAPRPVRADRSLTPDTPYRVKGLEDAVVCATVDPGFTTDTWLTAAEMVPGDLSLAHHAVLLIDERFGPEDPDATEAGWTECFGEVGRTTPVLFWAPGTGPFRAPEGAALWVPAGARLVIQMHYHPTEPVDTTTRPTVRLQLADTAPDQVVRLHMLGNARDASQGLRPGPDDPADGPAFRIPAGARSHTERMIHTLTGDPEVPFRVFAIGHHMHRFGVAARTRLLDGEDAGCLLSTPSWDYDWHRLYRYDAEAEDLPVVYGGDRIALSCSYTNTLDHPGAARTYAEAGVEGPVDIGLGSRELDEMCNVLVATVGPRPPFGAP